MFRRNTVFIVGAGASKELGLPVGAELSAQIAALCELKFGDWGEPGDAATRTMLRILTSKSEGDQSRVDAWRSAMTAIRKALPFKDSIDAVIDQFYDRPEVAQIGKFMIATLIMKAEAESTLKPTIDGKGPLLSRAHGTWLHSFSRMTFEGLRSERLEDIGKNVAVICFNYDRCIEWYLAQAIVETYGCPVDEAIAFATQIKIIHAYGSLGDLPGWPRREQTGSDVPFGAENRDAWVASRNLKTFSESVDSETDDAIKSVISAGEQYVYLGLSFGRQNMQLLSVPSTPQKPYERAAFASGMGQFEQGRTAICNLIKQTYGRNVLQGSKPGGRTILELNTTAKQLLDLHWHNILG